MSPTQQKVRVAVIGYGFSGRSFHSYLVGLVPTLELVGIASRNPETREQIQKERGCKTYKSFEAVLNDPSVDAVILATPNSTHASMAVQALEAGKHVVTDKIMALTEADCSRMIAASERAGKLLTVFQNRRWDGDFLTLRKLVDDGRLGALRWLEMAWQGFGAWGGWRGRREMGGGKLYDLGAHMIDQILQIFRSEPVTVWARMHYDIPHTDVESHALVVIGFSRGETAVCDVSSLSAIPKPRIHAFGTHATFMKYGLDPQEQAMIKGDIDSAVENPSSYGRLHDGKTETIVPTIPGRWRSFYENFADAVLKGAPLAVDPRDVARSVRVIEAAFRSANSGSLVRLSESSNRKE